MDLGADLSMQSLTKYVNGHSDVLMGGIIMNDASLYKRLKTAQQDLGIVPSPFDCYLASRGMRTMEIRMERHAENAMKLARALEKNPRVTKVIYPGLESHPQHEFAKRTLKNFGGMLEQTIAFLKLTKVFQFAVSLGGYESLVEHPYAFYFN